MSDNTRDRLETLASGFMDARILLTGVELDVFTVLGEKARRAKDVARRTKTGPESMERLLNALVGLKVLTKRKGYYRNTKAARKHLCADSPEPLQHIMLHRVNLWDRWSRLTRVVRTGEVSPITRTRKQQNAFIRGMSNIAVRSAAEAADVLKPELRSTRRLLDVGGGPGVYACEFAKRIPGLRATVLDLPGPLEIARETIESYGLKNWVDVKAADVLKSSSFGRDYDMVLLSNLIHSFQRPVVEKVMTKAAKALVRGGYLVVKEFFIEREATWPPFCALFSINMLVADGGDCFSRAEVEAWMDAAGVEPVRYIPVAKASGLLVGMKR